MIVDGKTYQAALEEMCKWEKVGFDFETTGLRPYHESKILGLGLSNGFVSYYLDLNILGFDELCRIKNVFNNPLKTFYAHNAKFDMAFLLQLGVEVTGTIHCTKAVARILYNDHFKYGLDDCVQRDLGERKDDAVKEYLKKHKLFTKQEVPGKKLKRTNWHFDQVPLNILAPYCEKDAMLTYRLGVFQEGRIEEIANAIEPGLPNIRDVLENERQLTRSVFNIERTGLRINGDLCRENIERLRHIQDKAVDTFQQECGVPFVDSSKLFAKTFKKDEKRWGTTKKGNPSFGSEHLKKFKHPASQSVIEYRDAKSKSNFINGFLYWADVNSDVHPNLDPAGTGTGRFSSSDPNFQNLEKSGVSDDDGEGVHKVKVRRAIVPREDYCFLLLDYDQMEYRMMLDYAGEKNVIYKVLEGLDVHSATAETIGVDRKTAKTINFMLLYGGGAAKLASALGVSLKKAKELKQHYFDELPEVGAFIREVYNRAEQKEYIYNWLGRRSYFLNPTFTYRAPNYLIQGGCADVVKVAMNRIDRYLASLRSRIVLQVHDELVLEVHKKELNFVPKEVKKIMEEAYPYDNLPLTVGVEHSWVSLDDREKGWPC